MICNIQSKQFPTISILGVDSDGPTQWLFENINLNISKSHFQKSRLIINSTGESKVFASVGNSVFQQYFVEGRSQVEIEDNTFHIGYGTNETKIKVSNGNVSVRGCVFSGESRLPLQPYLWKM